MTWLLEKGYVRKVGEITASYGRKMGFFLPGTEVHVSSRADKPSRTNATKATTRTKKRNISEPYSLEKRLSEARGRDSSMSRFGRRKRHYRSLDSVEPFPNEVPLFEINKSPSSRQIFRCVTLY